MAERPSERAARRGRMVEQQLLLAHRRADLEEYWSLCERQGQPVADEEKASELVVSEMEILGADFVFAYLIGNEVREWRNTKNPACVRYALTLCRAHGLEVAPALLKEAASIVQTREKLNLSLKRLHQGRIHDWGHSIMVGLIAAGDKTGPASRKAAQLIALNTPSELWIKASVLEKSYPAKWRDIADEPTKEASFIARWNELQNHETQQGWLRLRSTLSEAEGDLRGERR